MWVELDVFSGRPNPGWELSPDEADEAHARLAAATQIPAQSTPLALGYRGLTLTTSRPDDREAGTIRVCRGVIAIGRENQTRSFRDTAGLEGWLLDRAREQGLGPLVDQIQR